MDSQSKQEAGAAGAIKAAEVLSQLLSGQSAAFKQLLELVDDDSKHLVLHHLDASALGLVVATLRQQVKRPILVLTAGMERAEQLVDDLEFFGVPDVLHYPKMEVLPYDEEDFSLEVTSKYLDVYEALARARDGKTAPLITAPVDAVMQRVLPADALSAKTIRFSWGERVDLGKLAEALDHAGYTREGIVESRGEFSIRGSIVDIYPPNTDDPIRLDLFGDEIESIRKFDVATQRSTEDLGTEVRLTIPGARIKHHLGEHLRQGNKLATFFDLLPANTLILLEGPERFEEVCTYFESAVDRQFYEVLHESSDLGPPDRLIVPTKEIFRNLEKFRRIEHSRLPFDARDKLATHIEFDTAGYTAISGDLQAWLGAIRKRQHSDYLVVIVCDNEGQAQRLDEVLKENEVSAVQLISETDARSYKTRDVLAGYRDVILVVGGMHEGFIFNDARIAVVTDREIFGRYKRRHTYKKIYKGRPIHTSNDILRGDYVVHIEHGVGQYTGMRQQQIDGRIHDLLELLYSGGDKLLVPVEKIRYVQKYANSDAENVALDRLGTGRWAKRRAKSREEIEKLAEELIKIYAKREVARRKPFGPDNKWQTEFESSFPYQETVDQVKAILSAKMDMERHRPMDRLVCGDVGYGKTEVAIRTVFKCVQDKRQAAVLVPTTILALQHFKTFKERYADFPVRVEMMSRFQSAKEIKKIKEDLRKGEVNVVVGTHKLLGKDVQFLDLGLLVVDEEQRFGVQAKERLKDLRAEIDILTMTATPIPRTLNMALSGLRDLSVITTPPPDRHPIKTRIINWEEEQIAEAILRELNRGGQVFFIHNRVHNIHEVAGKLQKIVPHAKIGVAHGQMKEDELEEHMIQFVEGGYDILISTTIVESGIDIPNANTIIINRADAFGLAQLYQLRGRVGREKRRAYAYLVVPQGQAITDTAVRRLAAIEEFTELGAGFNIAMRDMEIRGAGNLLGKEQHGIVNEIGFDLYCEMLQDAVARHRGEEVHHQHDVEIKWPVNSYIPAPYIPVEAQRVNFYKRLATMRLQTDVSDLESELKDRYGEAPSSVQALLSITRMRLAGARMRVAMIDGSGTGIKISLVTPEAETWKKPLELKLKDLKGIKSARPEGALTIVITHEATQNQLDRIGWVTELLNAVHVSMHPEVAAAVT